MFNICNYGSKWMVFNKGAIGFISLCNKDFTSSAVCI